MHQLGVQMQALSAALVAMTFGCGGLAEEDASFQTKVAPIEVWAVPAGSEFDTSTRVELAVSSPADIFYTLDGTEPSSAAALPYRGPIQLTESTLLSFIAQSPGEVWSVPRAEFYERKLTLDTPRPVQRALTVSNESLFFSAEHGSKEIITKSVFLRSSGLSTVTIKGMVLTGNPAGSSFWKDNAFRFEILTEGQFPLFLPPGRSLELEVSYVPTETLASAAIFVDSDDETSGEELVIELWGRSIDW